MVVGWELNADIDYLEFRPSEIAAAVVIAVAGENQTLNDPEKAINMFGLNTRKVMSMFLLPNFVATY